MAPESFGPEERRAYTELALLQALLQTDERAYPWNPGDPEVDTFFACLEQNPDLEGCSQEEIETQSQAFFAQLDQLWSEVEAVITSRTSQDSLVARLRVALSQQSAVSLPKTLVSDIANQAQQLAHTNLSRVEQLVQCVQAVLPNWTEEDLHVLARPFAYSMRDQAAQEPGRLRSTDRAIDWTTLSEIEQARLSLAIAHYAITQLQQTDNQE